MKNKFLIFSLIVLFTISCKNRNAVDSQIEEIIYEYSNKYKLKSPNIAEEFSAKQSYEIGFFKNNDIDTLFYIVKREAYGLKEIGIVGTSSFSDKLKIKDKNILEYPLYLGSFFHREDSIPINVYDVLEKYGRPYYNFDELHTLNFNDYIITEEHYNIYTPNAWIYKVEENKFNKIAETDTLSFNMKKFITPED